VAIAVAQIYADIVPLQLWTEKESRDFIETEYPWFLRTYDGYRYPVQRVDAVRYFIMLHYGGIYMDLDNVGDFLAGPCPVFLLSSKY
jgi:mannosyltransferase OCH1-like enzyme